MAEVKLYKNTSDKRCINKNLTNELIISGDIKTQYDSSTIIIPFDKSINDIEAYNYMYYGGKYYFINTKIYNGTNIIVAHFEIDLLETYKTEILNQVAVLERSENIYNRYLPDSNLQLNSYKRVQTKVFPNSFIPVGTPILICTSRGV